MPGKRNTVGSVGGARQMKSWSNGWHSGLETKGVSRKDLMREKTAARVVLEVCKRHAMEERSRPTLEACTGIEDVAEAIFHLDECDWDLLVRPNLT
uniref:(California timema) hypothetical protein n=1 Tax=Timema californicum TaxID=61474 RepID=A0A7R9PEX4_TIMCA|nr:unnamed protein product [Timema californicum]